jgi:hypothetical protein
MKKLIESLGLAADNLTLTESLRFSETARGPVIDVDFGQYRYVSGSRKKIIYFVPRAAAFTGTPGWHDDPEWIHNQVEDWSIEVTGDINEIIPRIEAHLKKHGPTFKRIRALEGKLQAMHKKMSASIGRGESDPYVEWASKLDNLVRSTYRVVRQSDFVEREIKRVEDYLKTSGISENVEIPSGQSGGKPAHDEDFKAGFKAGKLAAKDPDIDYNDAKKAFKKVQSKHGTQWLQGFDAALNLARGADRMDNVMIARKLGLVEAASEWRADLLSLLD